MLKVGVSKFLLVFIIPSVLFLCTTRAIASEFNSQLESAIEVSIADRSTVEGDSGMSPMSFTVSLNEAAESEISVSFETSDDTAISGEDYIAANGKVTFTAGSTQESIQVLIIGDVDYADQDPEESFFLSLSNPSGAILGPSSTANAIILNDDLTKKQAYDNLAVLREIFFDKAVYEPRLPNESYFGYIPTNIDLDADGDLDVVAGVVLGENTETEQREVGELHIFRNNVGKGFDLEPTGVFGFARDVLVKDFNGDGRDDMYYVEHGYDLPPFPGHTDYLFLQTVAGGLADATSSGLPTIQDFAHGGCAGDLDNANGIDIVTASNDSFKLLMNDGAGKFTDEADPRLPLGIISAVYIWDNDLQLTEPVEEWDDLQTRWLWCVLLDVDSDLDLDIVLGGANPSGKRTVSGDDLAHRHLLLLNDGSGNFSYDSIKSRITSTVVPLADPEGIGGNVIEMVADDFNSDECMDFLTVTSDYQTQEDVNFFVNDCSGEFSIAHSETHHPFVIDAELEDINQDGTTEYVLFAGYRPGRIFSNSNGTISSRVITTDDYLNLSPAAYMTISLAPIYPTIFVDSFE